MTTKTAHKSLPLLSIATYFLILTQSGVARETLPLSDVTDSPDVPELTVSESGWLFGGSVSLDFCSKQLTYGLIDNPHPILTPGVSLRLANEEWFTVEVGAEAIFDTTNWGYKEGGYNNRRWKYQEFTPGITLSRTWDFTDWMGSSLDTAINYTYEYHPQSCKKPMAGFSNPNTQWLNLEIAANDFWLRPALTVEYQLVRQGAKEEETGKGGIYATFAVAHDFDVGTALGMSEGELILTPTLGIGMANKQRNLCDFGESEAFMFRDGFGRVELTYSPIDGFALTPYLGFNQQLNAKARDAVGDDAFVLYAGIGVSYDF